MISVWLHTNSWSWRNSHEPGTRNKGIHTLVQSSCTVLAYRCFPCLMCMATELEIVCIRQRRESGSEFLRVWPSQGMSSCESCREDVLQFSTVSVCLACSILTWLSDIHRWWSRCLQPHIRYWGLRRRLLLFRRAWLLKISRAGESVGFSQTMVSIPRSLKTRIGNVTWCIEWPS